MQIGSLTCWSHIVRRIFLRQSVFSQPKVRNRGVAVWMWIMALDLLSFRGEPSLIGEARGDIWFVEFVDYSFSSQVRQKRRDQFRACFHVATARANTWSHACSMFWGYRAPISSAIFQKCWLINCFYMAWSIFCQAILCSTNRRSKIAGSSIGCNKCCQQIGFSVLFRVWSGNPGLTYHFWSP